jgi:hypothetical protein
MPAIEVLEINKCFGTFRTTENLSFFEISNFKSGTFVQAISGVLVPALCEVLTPTVSEMHVLTI